MSLITLPQRLLSRKTQSDAKHKSYITTDTIVIGAGPAGLATAACLTKQGVDYVMLEQTDEVAHAWKNHYDRLHLHTAKQYSALPYKKFPKLFARYPARQQVVRYLEDYAKTFNIEPKLGQTVVDISKYTPTPSKQKSRKTSKTPRWQVTALPTVTNDTNDTLQSDSKTDEKSTLETNETIYLANNVVIATGYNRVPQTPNWQGLEDFAGTVMHSHDYKNGKAFKGQTVLVVGFGNSGAEIALDLWEHGATPVQSVRSPVNVLPREVLGQPTLAMGIWQQHLPSKLADAMSRTTSKVLMGDLSKYGLKQPNKGVMETIKQSGKVPMLDVGTIDLIKRGEIKVYGGIERFEADAVVFADGKKVTIDAVVLATGYRPNVDDFLHLSGTDAPIVDEQGTPNPEYSGGKTPVRGLYFCGFYISPAGMFREMANEAKNIAKAISKG